MAKKERHVVNFNDFTGGLVTNQFRDSLLDNEFSELENADYLVRGGLIKRFGYTDIIPDVFTLVEIGVITQEAFEDISTLLLEKPAGFNGEEVIVVNPTLPETIIAEIWIYNLTLTQWEASGTTAIPSWFNENNFSGIKQSICNIFAKKYILLSGGGFQNPSVSDDDYEIIISAINGNLVIMNYIEPTVGNELLHSDGDPTVYPGRIIYSGIQTDNVFQTGQGLVNNLIATPGDAILIGELVHNEIGSTTDFVVGTLSSVKRVPTVTEYNALGGNALADDIYDDVQDAVSQQSFAVVNVRTNPNIGYVDNQSQLKAFLTIKTASIEDYEFKWSVRLPGETDYIVITRDVYTLKALGVITQDLFEDITALLIGKPTGFNGEEAVVVIPTTPQTVESEIWIYNTTSVAWEPSGISAVEEWNTGDLGRSMVYTPTTILKQDGSVSDGISFAYYAFKVESINIASPSEVQEFTMLQYKVTDINENRKEETNAVDINKCLSFEVSDDRIKFYNNGTPLWYKSVIKDESYIPVNGILNFDDIKTENVTGVISYRQGMLVFTESTIQLVVGRGDDIPDINNNFSPYITRAVSTNLGCISTYSIAVADDIIFFLSKNGMYGLDTLSVDSSRVNLIKVSDNIDNIVYRDTNSVGVVYNNKYYLFYPNRNMAIKLDYILGRRTTQSTIPTKPFSIDKSDKLNFHYVAIINQQLIGLSANEDMLQQNSITIKPDESLTNIDDIEFEEGFFLDDDVGYNQKISSKNFDSFPLAGSGNQQSLNKRVKQVFIKSQNYAKEETKFFFELFTEFGKVVNTYSNVITVKVLGGVRQVVKTVTRTPNVVNKTGFELGTIGSSILGTSDLGFYENSLTYINVISSPISKSYRFVFENDRDQPSVVVGYGADYLLYNKPRK